MPLLTVWPTDAADGAVTSEARWRKMARTWAPSGVVRSAGGEMAPSLAMPNLTVRSGACWVDGHYAELTGDQVLTATANGLAVVRFDPAANTAELLWRDGATTPTRSPTGTWELPIAKVVASALTDVRGLISSNSPGVTYINSAGRTLDVPVPDDGMYAVDAATDVAWQGVNGGWKAVKSTGGATMPAPFQLQQGWGAGLRSLGSVSIPPSPPWATGGVQYTVIAQYFCTGAAGSGADLTGDSIRSRFRVQPGVDQGISGFRIAHNDQCLITEVMGFSWAVGQAGSYFEIFVESAKPCNVGGSAVLIGVPAGSFG